MAIVSLRFSCSIAMLNNKGNGPMTTRSAPRVSSIEQTKPGELIKLLVDGKIEWAIVGLGTNQFRPFYVLSSRGCHVLDAGSDYGLSGQYEGRTVLNFGNTFAFEPDFNSACAIDKGEEFSTPGHLVALPDGLSIVLKAENRKGLSYADTKTAKHTEGERGRSRVAFSSWRLWLAEETGTGRTLAIEYGFNSIASAS